MTSELILNRKVGSKFGVELGYKLDRPTVGMSAKYEHMCTHTTHTMPSMSTNYTNILREIPFLV